MKNLGEEDRQNIIYDGIMVGSYLFSIFLIFFTPFQLELSNKFHQRVLSFSFKRMLFDLRFENRQFLQQICQYGLIYMTCSGTDPVVLNFK